MQSPRQRGQGLLEVIIAFAILGLGLGGALQLILSSGIQNRRTEVQSLATNFAREGLEVMRNIRDSNWLKHQAFDAGLVSTVDPADYDGTPVFNSVAAGWTLTFIPNPRTGLPTEFDVGGADIRSQPTPTYPVYVQGVAFGTFVQFKRIFYAKSICDSAGTETLILSGVCGGAGTKIGVAAIVKVQWKDRGKVSTVAVQENLYDWRL